MDRGIWATWYDLPEQGEARDEYLAWLHHVHIADMLSRYELTSLEGVGKYFVDTQEWSRQGVRTLIHAPHSPSLGVRIWPPA